jgi:hypothetical protein
MATASLGARVAMGPALTRFALTKQALTSALQTYSKLMRC